MSFWSISFHLLCSNIDCIPKIWLRCCIWRSSISKQLSLPNAPQELKWFCSSPSPAVLPAQFRLQVKLLNGVQIFLRHCSKRHYSAVAFFPPMNRSIYPRFLVPHALVQKTAKPALTLVLPRQALLHLQLLRGAAPRHFLLPGTPEGSASQQGWLSNRHNQIPQAESNQFACLLQLQKAVSLSLCHS